MATNLIVRNVDEEVALALKQRAAANGRSAEGEHREILKTVLKRPRRRTVADILASMPDVARTPISTPGRVSWLCTWSTRM